MYPYDLPEPCVFHCLFAALLPFSSARTASCGVRLSALAVGLVLAQAAVEARCLFQLPDTRLQRSDLFLHVRFRSPPT